MYRLLIDAHQSKTEKKKKKMVKERYDPKRISFIQRIDTQGNIINYYYYQSQAKVNGNWITL